MPAKLSCTGRESELLCHDLNIILLKRRRLHPDPRRSSVKNRHRHQDCNSLHATSVFQRCPEHGQSSTDSHAWRFSGSQSTWPSRSVEGAVTATSVSSSESSSLSLAEISTAAFVASAWALTSAAAARFAFSIWRFSFWRRFFSPGPHRWQNWHSPC